ncbi:hypothetical protein GCM10010123_41940 [Pilimelia anulata]|uniref:Ricin B lectin domain-containing protein n=1 Tax=Pilimelia anulata TaxID=53371 RepID=A0A8J3FC78_9ACTN|nr:ricin-type beta-trefoil lectin domain protein [Pilimelia anulata]GGK07595.1 hypothetical protein GCM10010123_41940 [Pilimelia anulata]
MRGGQAASPPCRRAPATPPRARLRAAVRRWREDRGSLPMAMLLIMIVVSTSTVVLSTTVVEVTATRQEVQRDRTLTAARSGLDLAVAHIRAARSTTDPAAGDYRRLPCGPLAAGEADGTRYRALISYVTENPHGRTAEWLAANAIPCDDNGPAVSPGWAVVRSAGAASGTGDIAAGPHRQLWVTYMFQTLDAVLPGGHIRGWGSDLCFDAGAAPAVGQALRLSTCAEGASRQQFAYRPDLSLLLVSTARTTPLCVDGGSGHRVGDAVLLQRCLQPMSWRQQWSINGLANFQGVDSSGGTDEVCLGSYRGGVNNTPVVLDDCSWDSRVENPYNVRHTFTPDATVGAGRAGAVSGQLVNYHQFGRCVDVTDQRVSRGFLILWPCKQQPTGLAHWNERLNLPAIPAGATSATGPITIVVPSGSSSPAGTYCLQSPGSTAAAQYVAAVTCDPTGRTPAGTRWTVSGATGDVETSYRIREARDGGGEGYCMSATDAATRPDFFRPEEFPDIGKLVVADCDGGNLQKWNAPPILSAGPPLRDYGEGATGP